MNRRISLTSALLIVPIAIVATAQFAKPLRDGILGLLTSQQQQQQQEENAQGDKEIIIHLPSQPRKSHQRTILLIIVPGALLSQEDYEPISKAIQTKAAKDHDIYMVVGIGILLDESRRAKACTDKNKNIIANQVPQKAKQVANISKFDDTFLLGHSFGAIVAVESGYPSAFSGLIFFGACWAQLAITIPYNIVTYPRPAMTIIGDRDGFTRYLKLASESRELVRYQKSGIQKDIDTKNDIVSHILHLTKPVIVLSEINHMQLSSGVTPERTRQTGRSDLSSNMPYEKAQDILSNLVLDFIVTHSCQENDNQVEAKTTTTTTTRTTKTKIATSNNFDTPQSRILKLVDASRDRLDIFQELIEPSYISNFMKDVYMKLLHLEPNGVDSLPLIIAEWRGGIPNDLLFSRPKWDDNMNCEFIQIAEQDPIKLSFVPQISKTIAFKAYSPEYILSKTLQNNGTRKYKQINKDSSTRPTLQSINQETFNHVLNKVVTKDQRGRYLQHGTKLQFGPDILIHNPPDWVATPIAVNKNHNETTNEVYYTLQSPYTFSSMTRAKPFDGAWYAKPLTPSQAYEWIIFDCYKPIS